MGAKPPNRRVDKEKRKRARKGLLAFLNRLKAACKLME